MRLPHILVRSYTLFIAALVVAFQPAAFAQCTPQWTLSEGIPGCDGFVRAIAFRDPDGAGPLPPRLVIAGTFNYAGTKVANGIAEWDGTSWVPLGTGILFGGTETDGVYALTIAQNGDLIAGGKFYNAGGVPVNNIARWNGTSWIALGTGVVNPGSSRVVYSLATLSSGDIVAAGTITAAGGSSVSNIAKWNGSTWSPLGAGISGLVDSVAVLPNGDLVAGGVFSTAGGSAAANIARWDGSAWSPMGAGMLSGPLLGAGVYSLAVDSNGRLVAGGTFSTAGGVSARCIARWDGAAWSPIGTTNPGGSSDRVVWSVAALDGGNLIAAGFSSSSGDPSYVSRWDGQSWTLLSSNITSYLAGSQATTVRSITPTPDGRILVGGNFTSIDYKPFPGIAAWTAGTWTAPTPGMCGPAWALVADSSGNLVVGGGFTTAGSTSVNGVASWDGLAWHPLGNGLGNAVNTLAALPNGDVLAGGSFWQPEGHTLSRWNGTTWSSVGGFSPDTSSGSRIDRILPIASNNLIVGGTFRFAGAQSNIARWDGAQWSTLGGGTNNNVDALASLPNGDVIAGGSFTTAGAVSVSLVARWDGLTWWPMGSLTGAYVRALLALPNGDVLAGGSFSAQGGNNVARWNGSDWSALGGGTDSSVVALTSWNSDVVAIGYFSSAGGVPARRIARWNGSAWSAMNEGLDAYAQALTAMPDGSLIVADAVYGHFVGTYNGSYLARFACPPCYPNCDSSTIPPILNVNDFQCFLNKFAASDPYANCDHSTSPPTLNVNDFQCFLNAFAAGCS